MQVILKPVSHPDLGDIIIQDSLFAVGRHEQPFAGYPAEIAGKLSRRHARIFEQDGSIYVADVGSLNGTTVNDARVERQPLKLHRGDEINFAGHLIYRAELLVASRTVATEAAPAPIVLVLSPEQTDSGLQPIVVTQFPFLVAKTDEVLSRYAEQFPDELRYVSRRHAHVFQRDGRLYVEDLGSTNGTYLSGERLDEHAQPLSNGDTLAFGGKHFSYRVRIESPGEPATAVQAQAADQSTGTDALPLPDAAPVPVPVEDVTRTTFVSAANSFLDIFCADDAAGEEARAGAEHGGEAAAAEDTGEARRTPRWGAAGRAGALLRELKGAISEESTASPWRTRWMIAALVLVATGIGFWYYRSAPERDLRALLDAGQYETGARQAVAYLDRHGPKRAVETLAREAVLKATVPQWMAAVQREDFAAARATLQQAHDLAGRLPSAEEALALLGWITDLEAHVTERGGPGAPLVLFRDEARIDDLLEWWDADKKGHRGTQLDIAQQVPEFGELSTELFSHLRSLQSDASLYLPAMARLQSEVRAALAGGDLSGLDARLEDYARRYPRIHGIEQVQQDLVRYEAVKHSLDAGRVFEAAQVMDGLKFATPPFQERAAALRAGTLPGPDVLAQYRQAEEAWRAGDFDRAEALLRQLAQGPWKQAVQPQQAHNAAVLADFRAVQRAKGSPDYQARLLAFYSSLDPAHDAWFAKSAAGEFEQQKQQVLAQAGEALERARKDWDTYVANGGIRGLHRLEARVSDTFQRQARLLTAAHQAVAQGLQAYRLLQMEPPQPWQHLARAVHDEVALQRRGLTELSMVLEPSLLEAKLHLLPDPQADREPAGARGESSH